MNILLSVFTTLIVLTTVRSEDDEEQVKTTTEILSGEWKLQQWTSHIGNGTVHNLMKGTAFLNDTDGDGLLTGTAVLNETNTFSIKGVSRSGNNEVELTFLDSLASVDSNPWLIITMRPMPVNKIRGSTLPYKRGSESGTALITFHNEDTVYVRLFPQTSSDKFIESFLFQRSPPPGGIMDNWKLFIMTGLGFIFAKLFTGYLMGNNGVSFTKQWQKERAVKLTKREKAARALDLRRRKAKKQ